MIKSVLAIGCSFTEGCELGSHLKLSPMDVTSIHDPRCSTEHAEWILDHAYPSIVGAELGPDVSVVNLGMAGTSNDYNVVRLVDHMSNQPKSNDRSETLVIFGSTNMDRYMVYYNGEPMPIIPHTFKQYLNTNLRHKDIATNSDDVDLYGLFCEIDVLINCNFDTCARRMLHAWHDFINYVTHYGYGHKLIVPAFGTRPFWFFNKPSDFDAHIIPTDIELSYQLVRQHVMDAEYHDTFHSYVKHVLFSDDMYAAAQREGHPVTPSHALEAGHQHFAKRIVHHIHRNMNI